MKIEKRLYQWNDNISQLGIKLRQSKQELIDSGTITPIHNDIGEIEYTGKDKNPHIVKFKNDFVEAIWFNHQNEIIIQDTDLREFISEKGIDTLSNLFKEVKFKGNISSFIKNYHQTDLLYIIYQDDIIAMLGLLATK